ncbi:MAG: F0F1 ATP synthase subunit epsilon [Candidatus Latescibacterota bacterium]
MADSIQLMVVTPDRVVLSEEVDRVEVPGSEGYFEVLPKHTPFLTSIKTGQVLYAKDGREELISTDGGFVEVLMDRVTILAETAEKAHEIDQARAEEARQRAERILKERDSDTDVARAEAAMRRALNRLTVVKRAQSG